MQSQIIFSGSRYDERTSQRIGALYASLAGAPEDAVELTLRRNWVQIIDKTEPFVIAEMRVGENAEEALADTRKMLETTRTALQEHEVVQAIRNWLDCYPAARVQF